MVYGGSLILVWGRIFLGARTELVVGDGGNTTSEWYTRNILEEHDVPFTPFIVDSFSLIHDNVRFHSARSVQAHLNHLDIPMMQWLARSLDKNPIEHVLDFLKRCVKLRIPPVVLRNALLEEWQTLPQNTLHIINCSMLRWMETIIRARGGNTHH